MCDCADCVLCRAVRIQEDRGERPLDHPSMLFGFVIAMRCLSEGGTEVVGGQVRRRIIMKPTRKWYEMWLCDNHLDWMAGDGVIGPDA